MLAHRGSIKGGGRRVLVEDEEELEAGEEGEVGEDEVEDSCCISLFTARSRSLGELLSSTQTL